MKESKGYQNGKKIANTLLMAMISIK